MVKLIESSKEDLKLFCEWEKLDGVGEFICPYTIEHHRQEFEKEEIIYLSITLNSQVVGFVLLKMEEDKKSVEFRRIVVGEKGRGIGQSALKKIEEYCFNKLQRERIWLDVFSYNERGIHIYEKQGYKQIDETSIDGNKVFIYEKLK